MQLKLNFSARIALFIWGFFLFQSIGAQENFNNTDSLEIEYLKGNFSKEQELEILNELTKQINNPEKILKYSSKIILKAKARNSPEFLFSGLLQKGNAFRLKGDISKAFEFYFEALDLAKTLDDDVRVAMSQIAIGNAYSESGNHLSSIDFYEKGIKKFRTIKADSVLLATALLNAGDEYMGEGKYDKAMSYFFESSYICKLLGDKICSAYNLGNIGMVYAKQNKPKLAEANINEAIGILEQKKDYYPISVYLNYISDIYLKSNDIQLAKNYANRSLDLAKKYKLKDEISQANLQLSKIFQQTDKPAQALFHYKEYSKYKDSVNNIKSSQKMGHLRTEFEVSKKQVELDLLNQKRKNEKILMYSFVGAMVLLSILSLGLYKRNRFIQKTQNLIDKEKDKTNQLLLNILPKDTAIELKQNGRVIAKKYEKVTVLFTDFKDFTKYAENLPAEILVETIDMYFSEFDKIIEKYGLEKIKTIGDSYMCAGGLPLHNDTHPIDIAEAALEILEYTKKKKQVYTVNEVRFDVRIGIHTGPVVAGVVGKNKFSYDIWGDTVNIASRLESKCEVGKINVSQNTYHYLSDDYIFENRGEIPIKNRGKISMYYLTGKK